MDLAPNEPENTELCHITYVITLYFQAHSVLNPNGILLIAVVLPFNPYVERGGKDNKPLVDISAYQSTSRNHWDQVETFVKAIQRK